MEQYIRSVLYFTLIATVLSQIAPGEHNRKIISMVTGLLVVLVFLSPLLNKGGIDVKLKQIWDENAYAVVGGSETQQSFLEEQYENQIVLLVQQLCPNAQVYAEVTFDDADDAGSHTAVKRIRVRVKGGAEAQEETIRQMLTAVYDVDADNVSVRGY
jgi:hypothetical protein